MSIFADPTDLEDARAYYDEAIREILYTEATETVAELELRALATMPAVMHPAIALEPARLFVEVLEECADATAAGALTVISRMASAPVAEAAGAAVARLALDGITSSWAPAIGTLRVLDCQRCTMVDDVDAYTMVLGGRPDDGAAAQAALVTIGPGIIHDEHEVVGVVDVTLPMTVEDARDRAALHARFGQRREEVDPRHLEDRLRSVLGDMVRSGHPLEEGGLGPLCVLDRALCGRAATLPRPLLLDPLAYDDEGLRDVGRRRPRRARRRRSRRR